MKQQRTTHSTKLPFVKIRIKDTGSEYPRRGLRCHALFGGLKCLASLRDITMRRGIGHAQVNTLETHQTTCGGHSEPYDFHLPAGHLSISSRHLGSANWIHTRRVTRTPFHSDLGGALSCVSSLVLCECRTENPVEGFRPALHLNIALAMRYQQLGAPPPSTHTGHLMISSDNVVYRSPLPPPDS